MTADPNTPLHPSEAKPTRTRLIMTGGFLGAGKTTLLLRLGEWLTSRGLRVGLVTNDQAGGLVDTSLGRAHDLAVEEIDRAEREAKANAKQAWEGLIARLRDRNERLEARNPLDRK